MDRPRLVYLDQFVWVRLAQGIHRGDNDTITLRRDLIMAVSEGRISVPLSAAHYLETWHRRDRSSRWNLASIMRDVSRYDSLAPIHAVRNWELRAAVAKRLRPDLTTYKPADRVSGVGVNHAFQSEIGRFRVVAHLASTNRDEGPPVEEPEELVALGKAGGPAWEWHNLFGDQETVESGGLERTPEHRLGDIFKREELAIRDGLETHALALTRLRDVLITQELMSMIDEINEVCQELNVDPRQMFRDPHDVLTFLEDLPTVSVLTELRYLRHRDREIPWKQHDRTDLIALSVAVPYADVVVTERHWVHLLRASKLDRRWDTEVLSDMNQLRDVLSL